MAAVVTGTTLSVVVDVALKIILEEELLESLSLSANLMAARVSSKGLSWPLQLRRQQGEKARRKVKARIVEVAPGFDLIFPLQDFSLTWEGLEPALGWGWVDGWLYRGGWGRRDQF